MTSRVDYKALGVLDGDGPTPDETLRFVGLLFRIRPEKRWHAYRLLEPFADNGGRGKRLQ